MHILTNSVIRTLQKLLPDSPENVPIFFSALSKHGRYWLDDPKDPTALVVGTGGNAPVTILRKLTREATPDWKKMLADVAPSCALCGDLADVAAVAADLGYAEPSIEVIHAQRGTLRAQRDLAVQISRYDSKTFALVNANAPWLWDGYPSAQGALDSFPAFAQLESDAIVALAIVNAHSLRWASIGYWVHPDFRKSKYATRCTAALASYLNQRKFQVTATTDPTHAASLAVMRKIGLHEHARTAMAPLKNGK